MSSSFITMPDNEEEDPPARQEKEEEEDNSIENEVESSEREEGNVDSQPPIKPSVVESSSETVQNKGSEDEDPWSASLSEDEGPASSTSPRSIPIQDTKGAQVLMNRFSSWRKKANEAVAQNVQAFSQTELAQQLKTRAEVASQNVQAFSQTELAQQLKTRAEVAFRNSATGGSDEKKEPKDETTAPSSDVKQQQPMQSEEILEEAPHDHISESPDTEIARNAPTPEGQPPADEDYGAATEDDSDVGATSGDDDESDYHITDYSESASMDASGLRSAAAALYVRTAASVVADSVATGFRGRYGEESEPTPKKKCAKSQTAKILASPAAAHMQSILDEMDESHEYIMLLGHGMLGVNLRQTYLKNHGVYVDYLVEGGAAYNSGVVYPGDIIQKVGNISVAKGTILNVPKTVADAKRPSVLVFSTGLKVETPKVDYIDLSIAMMHSIKEEESNRGISRMPLVRYKPAPPPLKVDGVDESAQANITSNHLPGSSGEQQPPPAQQDDDKDAADAKQEPAQDEEDRAASNETGEEKQWTIPPHPLNAINPANVPPPPPSAKEALEAHLAKRGNGAFAFDMMTNAAATTGMDNFRTALRHAFVTCALDGRRLPFLSRHFATLNTIDEGDTRKVNEDAQNTNASVELMLFLELAAFVELYDATPKSRRRDIAKRIAFKFFLSSKVGNRVEKPMFDFSHLVDEKELVALRDLLIEPAGEEQPPPILRSTFLPFQDAVVEKLHHTPFLSFLMSNECARMRGYLRNTSPYRTVSPGDFFYHVVAVEKDDHSSNHLLYNLVYLLCQRERETCGENDDIVGEKSNRVIGAAGGLCCAMFIKKTLTRVVEAAKVQLDKDALPTAEEFQELKVAYEQLWDTFVSPNGGALELLSNSNETEDELAIVRKLLGLAAMEKNPKARLEILTNNEISHALTHLVDNLVYDYSVNAYARFREHPFHEWMCAEVCRASTGFHDVDNRIPKLTHGSITRLIRRAELPNGISSHKPYIASKETNEHDITNKEKKSTETLASTASLPSASSKMQYPNAHHAIVFGTDDGSDIIDRSANPSLSQFDIRRYTCQQVWFDHEKCEQPAKLCRVPPTIETYAILPPLRKSPFSQLENAERVSSDGWEVSLINFMIPGSESQDGGTYGVSLVFQQDEATFINTNGTSQSDITPMKLVFQEPAEKELFYDSTGEPIDIAPFASPIDISSPEPEAVSSDARPPVSRVLRVATDTPSFNRRLAGKSWIERVKNQRCSMPTRVPVTIGIVLVSSRNVIYAMRDSLSQLLGDFSKSSADGEDEDQFVCKSLVELLGNFAHLDVEHESLLSVLRPYLRFGSSPWLRQPARLQAEEFAMESGQRLIESLPLVPLALLYVTVLLEQKVVFSSSRRGVLMSAVTAITKLLHPFKWEHLVVPLVPSSLARDLMEYPAPFIIGLAAEDEGNLELLNSLPDDVTLVDLDVGRVILAPSISYDDEPITRDFGHKRRSKAHALRSQILYLAQALGVVFGSRLRNQGWCGDSPLISFSKQSNTQDTASFGQLQAICRSFLTELLAGAESCCHWIEEHRPADMPVSQTEVERTVLFDEDRFFQIKNLRALRKYTPLFDESPGVGELALSLDDFDLVLECFLRCQSMSTYVSSRPKESMAFF